MVSADYEHSRVVMPKGKGRGETRHKKKENEAKVPKHFKELVEGELVFTSAHTKEAGDEPVKKSKKEYRQFSAPRKHRRSLR